MPAIPTAPRDLVSRDQIRNTLARVQQVLSEACGPDKRLSQDDVKNVLDTLAPTERVLVDAFATEIVRKERKRGGIVTVSDIERAVKSAQRMLAPKSGAEELDAEALAAAKNFGASLVTLSRRLQGDANAALPPLPALEPHELEGKSNAELVQELRARCLPHLTLSYGIARDVMFTHVDNKGGTVREVYGGREAPAESRADMAAHHQINTEHTHPRSLGVDGTPALSDLHHLFPTDAVANGKRSSLPFGVVVSTTWEKDGSKLGTDANGTLVFEPPEAHKGDVARAMFYVSAMYGLAIGDDEEAVLRSWNALDPVDEVEKARNDEISRFQENRNPFVDDPGLVDRIDDF